MVIRNNPPSEECIRGCPVTGRRVRTLGEYHYFVLVVKPTSQPGMYE